ncbi:MAG TPA: homocysteine S-methyltransferase [Roseiflexaceae bacterium]|nr:homocysteine S-methyltransferase [Roseiflexaceae bacterium]
MNPIADILQKHPVVVLDGALATELERRGADLHDPLWSAKVLLEAPELIRAVHLDYFRAGADCAITASYQASVPGLARRGLSETEALDLIQSSVRLAAEARDAFWGDGSAHAGRSRPFVAASVGPYGAFLADGSEYRGDYGLNEEALIDFHRPRMAALVAAGADMLACETIPCLLEARALAILIAEFPSVSAWFSFSARDQEHICHGERLADCAALLDAHPQVAALGVNCTAPQHIAGLIRAARSATQKPILVYPNSGEIYNAADNSWYGETSSADFGKQSQRWNAAGARIIGGCCRTTPEHIRSVAAWSRNQA